MDYLHRLCTELWNTRHNLLGFWCWSQCTQFVAFLLITISEGIEIKEIFDAGKMFLFPWPTILLAIVHALSVSYCWICSTLSNIFLNRNPREQFLPAWAKPELWLSMENTVRPAKVKWCCYLSFICHSVKYVLCTDVVQMCISPAGVYSNSLAVGEFHIWQLIAVKRNIIVV